MLNNFDDLDKATIMETNDFYDSIKNSKTIKKVNDFFESIGLRQIFKDNGLVLAGGFLTRAAKNDFVGEYDLDFYFKDKASIKSLLIDIEIYNDINPYERRFIFKKFNSKFECVYKSDNAYTYKIENYKVQFIILDELINEDIIDTLNKFDFSICQIAYDLENEQLVYTDNFKNDIDDNKITYNLNCISPFSSFIRLEKYLARGFYMINVERLKLLLSIQQIQLNTYADVAKHLRGISTTYFSEFKEMLQSNDYKDKPYDLNEFFKLYEQYKEMKETFEELTK